MGVAVEHQVMVADHDEDDGRYMRASFRLAEEAGLQGIHPFAALLVDEQGEVLMKQVNAYLPDRDMTGHAERVLATRAGIAFSPEVLARCTLYSSAEPCALCAGAIYWRASAGSSMARVRNVSRK